MTNLTYKSAFNRKHFESFGYDKVTSAGAVKSFLHTYDLPYVGTGAQNVMARVSGGEVLELWVNFDNSTENLSYDLVYGPCPACGEEIGSHCVCSDDKRAGVTRVLFRVDDEGDVIAVMPDEPDMSWGNTRDDLYTCYAHIGQHSSCAAEYVFHNTRRAAPSEYANLKAELESLGYVVRPVTFAQVMSDDCNGGIGPENHAKGWYSVGCNWGERHGVRGMNSDMLQQYQISLRNQYGR